MKSELDSYIEQLIGDTAKIMTNCHELITATNGERQNLLSKVKQQKADAEHFFNTIKGD